MELGVTRSITSIRMSENELHNLEDALNLDYLFDFEYNAERIWKTAGFIVYAEDQIDLDEPENAELIGKVLELVKQVHSTDETALIRFIPV